MPQRIISARAPSNIALVKYMGKEDSQRNLPSNPSVSMTLDSLCSLVEVSVSEGESPELKWIPEVPSDIQKKLSPGKAFTVPRLDEVGIQRILNHFQRVREKIPSVLNRLGIAVTLESSLASQRFLLKSANTFPAASGIASSASSFAALTLAATVSRVADVEAFERAWQNEVSLRREVAKLSRVGSGSSCRSFEGPWVLWEKEEVRALESEAMPKMAHFVAVIKKDAKKVSSSQAHALIRTSPLWQGRPERASLRARALEQAILKGDLPLISRIAWTETWEMHSLFHTCEEPFSYWEPETIHALHDLSQWIRKGESVIVTMDAGPNIHVLVEESQREHWREILQKQFADIPLLEDRQGMGAVWIQQEVL